MWKCTEMEKKLYSKLQMVIVSRRQQTEKKNKNHKKDYNHSHTPFHSRFQNDRWSNRLAEGKTYSNDVINKNAAFRLAAQMNANAGDVCTVNERKMDGTLNTCNHCATTVIIIHRTDETEIKTKLNKSIAFGNQ